MITRFSPVGTRRNESTINPYVAGSSPVRAENNHAREHNSLKQLSHKVSHPQGHRSINSALYEQLRDSFPTTFSNNRTAGPCISKSNRKILFWHWNLGRPHELKTSRMKLFIREINSNGHFVLLQSVLTISFYILFCFLIVF